MDLLLLLLVVASWLVPGLEAHADNLLINSYCGTMLQAGSEIMGSSALSSTKSITVKRGTTALSSGSTFVRNEILYVSFEGGEEGVEYVFEVSGGGRFENKESGCASTRYANGVGTLVMPSGGQSRVIIWAGYTASASGPVMITTSFVLIAPTTGPTNRPTRVPTYSPGTTASPTTSTTSPTPSPTPAIVLPPAGYSTYVTFQMVGSAWDADVSEHKDLIEELVAQGVGLTRTQVKIMSIAASSSRRRFLLLLLRQLGSTYTVVVTIRVTNLADAAAVSATNTAVQTYLEATTSNGFKAMYLSRTDSSSAVLTSVSVQRSTLKVYSIETPSEKSCTLDATAGVRLSWASKAADGALPAYIDLQIEATGSGTGWVAAGFVDANRKMVTRPVPHKVMVMAGDKGDAAMYALSGYEGSQLEKVAMSDYAASPTLLQTASGKMVLRFRQFLNASAVPLTLHGTANVLWAASSHAAFPAKHDTKGYVTIDLAAGTCLAPTTPYLVPGFIVLALPLIGALFVRTSFRRTNLGRFLLRRRLSPISILPTWVHVLTLFTLPTLQNLKWGELFMILAYLIIHLALMAHWATQLGYNGGIDGWGLATGYGSLTTLLMMFVPVSKTGLLPTLLGISYERAVKFHRFLGAYFFLFLSLHFLLEFSKYPLWTWSPLPSGVVVGFGVLSYILYVTAGAAALFTLIRRRFFEAFKALHYLMVPAMALTAAHVPFTWPYVIVPLTIAFIDWLYRWNRSLRQASTAMLETVPGDLIRITMKRPRSAAGDDDDYTMPTAGEFYFVCFPCISPYQWHPICACGTSAQEEGELVFMVRNMGLGTWTGDVAALADKGRPVPPSPNSIYRITIGAGDQRSRYQALLLDGPFGCPTVDLERSQRLLLVAGGVGMTVVSSMMSQLAALRRAKDKAMNVEYLLVVWVVRDSDTVLAFADLLQALVEELTCQVPQDDDDSNQLARRGTSPPLSPSPVKSFGRAAAHPSSLPVSSAPPLRHPPSPLASPQQEEEDYDHGDSYGDSQAYGQGEQETSPKKGLSPRASAQTSAQRPPARPSMLRAPPRRLNFSMLVYVTQPSSGGPAVATGAGGGKGGGRRSSPTSAQEEGRPMSQGGGPNNNNKQPERGSAGGIDYEIGRPNLPKLYQAFFPSDTEVFKRASVLACAPDSLMQVAQREASVRGMAFHLHEFKW